LFSKRFLLGLPGTLSPLISDRCALDTELIEIAYIVFMVLLLGAAMFWGARYSKLKSDEHKRTYVPDPNQIGPYDLFQTGANSYWREFRKQFGSFLEWGKPMVLNEWDTFFCKITIGLLVLFFIVVACFAGT